MKRRLFALLLAVALPVWGQEPWPSRPITLIVPWGTGNTPDLIARVIADRLAPALGQPVIVSNRPGSSGLIGGDAAARSKPDGYTFLLGDDGLFTIAPHLYRHMPFNTATDFVPVVSLVENSFVLAIDPAVPATDLASFLALARAANPPLAYGSFGSGSQSHLTMERLRTLANVPLLHVPYRSSGQAALGIIGRDISAAFVGASAIAYLRNGKLRALATTGRTRSRTFPDLPLLSDTYPGLEMINWQGLFAPAGTPEAILQRMEAEVRAVMSSEELAQKLAGAGDLRVQLLAPGPFAARIREESEHYGEIIRRLGVKLD